MEKAFKLLSGNLFLKGFQKGSAQFSWLDAVTCCFKRATFKTQIGFDFFLKALEQKIAAVFLLNVADPEKEKERKIKTIKKDEKSG